MNFSGKNVIVTGASGGMGKLLCEKLAESGAKIAICSNDAEALKAQAEALNSKYGCVVSAECVDVTDEAQVKAFIDGAAKTMGSFDCLVNLAGLSIPTQYNEASVEAFDARVHRICCSLHPLILFAPNEI